MFPSYVLLMDINNKPTLCLRDGVELHSHIEFHMMKCPFIPSWCSSKFEQKGICLIYY